MAAAPRVLLSGFGDEAAVSKLAVEQVAVFAALGLDYYSLRFVDAGGGIKNVMALTKKEIRSLNKLHRDYGLRVATVGSPIGKIKLHDVEDGTKNRYVPAERYLREEVARAIDLAAAFDTKLLRGFSFYHPHGTPPEKYVPEVIDRIGAIADACGKAGCIFGLEVEANLVGQTGKLLAKIYRKLKSPHLVLIFDGANLAAQGMSAEQVFEEYVAMRPGIGWIHIKDYRVAPELKAARAAGKTHVDEESLTDFVPADRGDSGHEVILRDFREHLPKLERKLNRLGVPGVFLDLEPHLKKGGQFGGFSGPDGMGVALRSLCRLLDYVDIGYQIRDFEAVRASRDG
jgi:sugar phosphate isomerase/epimerase